MTSLQRVVSENNGLPEEEASVYIKLLYELCNRYNTGSDNFVLDYGWNYSQAANLAYAAGGSSLMDDLTGSRYTWNSSSYVEKTDVQLAHTTMKDIGDYGDIHCVQFKVCVAQPVWGWGSMSKTTYVQSNVSKGAANDWQRRYVASVFYYTYFVPDINYKAVTN